MIAKKRKVNLGATGTVETPLLVPSFSSKAIGDVVDFFGRFHKYIPTAYLISAYDVHYTPAPQVFKPITPLPRLVILDSGGYEAAKDAEVVGPYYGAHDSKPWEETFFAKVIETWDRSVPTALVNYDHPNVRISLATQISNAKAFFSDKTGFAKTFLIKPETKENYFISVENIAREASSLGAFDILGLTERELGDSFSERVKTVRRVRMILTEHNLDIPIHIFGNLDPVTTPIYFAAGADIFDGLNWSRYSMLDGGLEYLALFTARTLPDKADGLAFARTCRMNLNALEKLREQMIAYVNTGNLSAFGKNSELLNQLAVSILGGA
jgi:hypothetical protein